LKGLCAVGRERPNSRRLQRDYAPIRTAQH
jgi:hypothetical protein